MAPATLSAKTHSANCPVSGRQVTLSGNETGLSGTNSLSQYDGEVTAIDTANNTITVKKALISHTFQNATGLDRLGVHVGDEVNVTYQDKDGQNSVVRIDEVKPRDSASQ